MRRSIVLVDGSVANCHCLIDGLTKPAQMFILDGNADSLSQMAADLQGRTGIDAIHIISRGSQTACQYFVFIRKSTCLKSNTIWHQTGART